MTVVTFKYLMVHLVKENWREYIRKDNPVAAALLSKMNYSEEEKVKIKIEFARMMANMQLDLAKIRSLPLFSKPTCNWTRIRCPVVSSKNSL